MFKRIASYAAANRSRLAFILAFMAALAPALLLIGPGMLLDDANFFQAFLLHPITKGLRPFAFDSGTYWRPLATELMALPIAWISEFGGEGWFMIASKAISLGLFAWVGVCASAVAAKGASPSKAWAAAIAGALLALHPIFAEPSMWWSDRFDLMMCGWVALLLGALLSPDAKWKWVKVAAIAAAACLTKESGFFWCAGVGALALMLRGRAGLALAAPLWSAAAAIAGLRCAVVHFVSPAFLAGGPSEFEAAWSAKLFLLNMGRDALFTLLPHLDPAPLHFVELFEGPCLALGAVVLLAMSAMCALCIRARDAGRPDAALAWGFAALGLVVVCVQNALVSTVDPMHVHASTCTRYAAPTVMAFIILLCRSAVGSGKASMASAVALALVLASSVPVATQAKAYFASESDFWCASYDALPAPGLAVQCVANLRESGERVRAKEIAAKWRAANPSVANAELDALEQAP